MTWSQTPCEKKARLSQSKNGGSRDADYHLLSPSMQSPLRQLQPSSNQSQTVTSIDRRLAEIPSTKPERRKVFRRPPMSCESVPITRTDGQRLYLSIRHDREEKSDGLESKGLKKKLSRRGTGNSLQLLTVPFSVLRESVEEERRRRTIEESEKLTDSLQSQDEADWNQVDASGRPVHKVALLCGPPGLGKTTLSHVIARHAGYNVVEMNASDDRSPEVFRNTLEASTQMKSVLGVNEKPNCLVIDEIDGAPAPAVNVLLSVVKQKDSDTDPSQKGKKKKKTGPLSRPIICICNDQYAPALRQLRQVAFVVTFPPTIPSRLATRLLEISRQESVSTDMTTLTSLCEKTDNDIRSCLNTLQFIQKRHGRVGLQHVQAMDIGLKDSHRSLFSIWQEIFQLPKPKRRRFADVADTENHKSLGGGLEGNISSVGEQRGITSLASRFHTVLHSAMSNGQYDKVTQGLFENYLQVKFKDPSFEVVVCGTEWLEFSDFIEQAVIGQQSYILQGYSPFVSVAFHLFCASQSYSKLSYPSSQYESHLNETKTKNLVNAIKNESSPHIRKNISLRTACLDLFPFMLEVITPTLRPVNTQLFSASEKKQLAELINTMIAYNLTFHQERNFDGQYTYVLDPNVEEAVKFPGLPRHRQLTYAIKQLIAREIELEKMRRAERAFRAHADESSPNDTSGCKKQEEEKPKKPVVVLSLDTSKAKPRATKPALDFFGRPVKVKPKVTDDKTSWQSVRSQPSLIWFRFNEGYSNAVRKSVKVLEFF
ncbi:chromosome transmission fidelity protein 18 homolog [Stylophora pistillata]|uniref:chromosome transmission fidelity protein 18 homolog n=1 Tax=Stylophora pistillata TaxID=50429 RepID=UPI000C043711|nr:chromosome transmission fidelity protein 18 homolog [Stylophora pistillata]